MHCQKLCNPIADRQIMFSDDESYRKRIVRALNDVDIDVSGYRYDEEIMNCIRSV